MKEVPNGWKLVLLGEIANYINGKAFKPTEWSENGLPIIRIQNLNREKSEFNYCNFVVDDKYYVNKGDLLFAWSGTPDTSFGAHIWFGERAVLNQHIFKIIVNDAIILKQYYLHVLNNKVKEFVSKSHGTAGLAHITKNIFEQSQIPLPPIFEQHCIVAKIEELFSSLDKGIESLKTAQAQLKIYRQAVLKWAFEGKLTNDDVKEGELPEGWRWGRSNEVFEYITSGSRGWAKFYSDNGAIFLRMGNLDHDTILLDLSDIQYVKLPDKAEGTRSLIRSGDILISITADVGMIGLVPEKFPEAYINQHIALARPKAGIIHSTYLAWYFASKENGQKQLRELQRGATKVGLGLDDIRSVNIPVCPLKEQSRIVAEIESRLSVCDKLEDSITQSLLQSEALHQSILKKAFEGKLVPQNPNDESASILLERIRAERAAVVAKNATTRSGGKPGRRRNE